MSAMGRLPFAAALLWATVALADADESGKKEAPAPRRVIRDHPLEGKFSLAIDWGASFATNAPVALVAGAPLYLGGTLSFWVSDWFLLDLDVSHAFNNQRTALLSGPRFRTLTLPLSASIGLRAGVIFEPHVPARFGLSPIAAVDMLLVRHVLLGLEGCVDVPVGGNGVSVRVGLKVGWRF
jgi:hypothetical protein